MPLKKKRSPQEKKALSLLKDRRSAYGNNDKAARKSIPRNKALSIRRVRHQENQLLRSAKNDLSIDVTRPAKHREWRKWPDTPLGEHLKFSKRRKKPE
jgi:hypothetical protein